MLFRRLLPAFCLLTLVPAVRAQDAAVFKSLAPDKMEALLRDLKIEFKKVPSAKDNVVYYDLQRSNLTIRLYIFDGKDVMLDAIFKALPLDKVNQWNVRAKFSRACLHKDDKGEFTALEANLDLLGGVTEGTVRQFLTVFEDEVRTFTKFLAGAAAPGVEAIITKLDDAKLEGLLGSLNIKFKKLDTKAGIAAYEYVGNNHTLRLTSFGGQDLMIDAHFSKLRLEKVNDYNLKRKFIRAVAYKVGDKEFTSLETNLDCVGGVTDSIVRHFIRAFDDEVQEFTRFLSAK